MPLAFVSAFDVDDPMLGRVVSDFLVVAVVGSGGFGNVHHVLQLPLRGRPVHGALKRLRPSHGAGESQRDPAGMLRRFESEADALASLSHPHVVRLLKAGVDGDTPFLVLELVTDADTLEHVLHELARTGDTMSDEELLAVVGQTLKALAAAHEQNIVHRDIKPGNIMLQRAVGYDVFVRVLDFGLAKFIGESSETERVMGTLDYMAPEQLRGRDIGPWTDLYALGLVILQIITGRPSFSKDRAVLVSEKLDPSFDPVRRALGSLDPDALRVAFLRTATAHDRHLRYADVDSFRRAFLAAFTVVPPRITDRKHQRPRELTMLPPPPASPAPSPDPGTPENVAAPSSPGPVPVALAPAALAPFDTSRWPLLAAVDASRLRARLHQEVAARPGPPSTSEARSDTVEAGPIPSE